MATIKAIVLKHQKKEDGTWNVKVRVTHLRNAAYIAIPFFVVKDNMNRNYEITDNIVGTDVDNYVSRLRKILNELGTYVESYTVKELADFLKTKSLQGIKNKVVF